MSGQTPKSKRKTRKDKKGNQIVFVFFFFLQQILKTQPKKKKTETIKKIEDEINKNFQ